MSDVTPEGGAPAWATSVEAFADATSRSHVIVGGTQLQFPDTGQLGGLCGNLLGGSAFTGGLVGYGDPSQGGAGQVVTGLQNFADGLCGMAGGTGSDTSPQTIMSGATQVNDAVYASPMASGTIEMGQNGEPTHNSALDAINGMQSFANTMFDIFYGCGCAGDNAPDQASPQQIIDTTQSTADGITTNPMASGVLAMGQDGGGTGNVALDAINGAQAFANSLYTMLQSCGCGADSAPDSATPQAIINTAQDTTNAVNGSPFASGIIAMGQDPEGSGNVAVDAVNGTQTFANGLFSFLELCGCGTTTTGAPVPALNLPEGPLVVGTTPNPYDPRNVSPQTILSVAEATADAVHGNPFAAALLSGNTGNIGINSLASGQALVNDVHKAVAGSLAGNATLGDVATAGASAIQQNTANHVRHIALTTAQSVALKSENLLTEEDFSHPYTVMPDPDGHWVWDGTDNAPSTNIAGCLKATANGTLLEYVGVEVPVVPGENINLAVQYKTVALAYTGANPIALSVQKYRLGRDPGGAKTYIDIGGYDVVPVAAPAASSGTWVGIAGTYVGEPGVDQIRVKFKVAANASGGVVKFDAASLLKPDLIADECVPGVRGAAIDDVVTQLYGDAGAGFTRNESAVALGNTAASLASVTAQVAQLAAQGHTGAIAGDDFSWTGEITASANWGGGYSTTAFGVYQANGADAVWSEARPWSTGTADCHFDWEGTYANSTTDYQVVQAVLDSPPQAGVAYLRLFGRVSADWQNWVALRIGGDGTYQVLRAVAGVVAVMNSGTMPVPGAGSLITLYCGDKPTSAPRMFTAKVGSMTIASFTEAGTASQVGALYRGWGWGATYSRYALWSSGASSALPPAINQWLGMDA